VRLIALKLVSRPVRVDEEVTPLAPHSPGRAQLRHPVLRRTDSLSRWGMFLPPRDSSGPQRASASLASMAIRSGFVDTHVGFKAPPCCPGTILKRRSPPFLDRVPLSGVPRRHQYYEGSKTSCAEYEVAYLFASPPQLFASWFTPLQRRQPQGMALLILPHA
jgi:hypothetical protein